ncbi:MAG: hypothetical protein Q4C49_05205 [Bacillota bacterium]|nr:hypothetical protein [Bacillota bacterium]
MELLDNELLEVSGGAGLEHVTVKVMIVWKGSAEKRKNEAKLVEVKCWDNEGIAYGKLTPANDWTCKFRVLKKAEFDANIDVSVYKFISKVEKDWNQKANLMIFYVS